MCATPLEIDCGDKKYRLRPLSVTQWSFMEQWAKEQPFVEMERKLAAISDEKLRERAKDRLLDRAIELSESDEYVADKLNSGAAIEKLFGLMLKEHHPDVSEADVSRVLNIHGLVQIRQWVERMVGLGAAARKNSQGGEG